METNSSQPKKKGGFIKPVIAIAALLILGVGGYMIYVNSKEVTPDYNKYLDFINKGDSLVKINKFTEAKTSYNNSLKYNPRDSAATKKITRLDSADKLVKSQNFTEAKKMFQIVLNIQASPGLSSFALSKTGASNNLPMKITIKWKGDSLQITISGGVPYTNENRPYTIEGLECVNCVQWKKESSNYVANVVGAKIKTNKLKLSDQLGQFSYGNVPERQYASTQTSTTKTNTNPTRQPEKPLPAPSNSQASFAEHLKTGDSLFSLAKYPDAKAEYTSALSTHPDDNSVKKKILACDEKINAQKLSAAKNIPKARISLGTFTMGTDNGNAEDGPAHDVSIRPFSMGKTEVTVAQYKNFCTFTGRQMPPAPAYGWIDDNPVVNVTWDEARAYCEWVGGRLPTEAEWEYAASAGGKNSYSGSNQIDRVAFYKTNSGGKPNNVGRKGSNNFNLADLTGNVSEWCSDWFGKKYYSQSDAGNPKGPSSGLERVIRGGAYNSVPNSTQDGDQLRITYRNSEDPASRQPYIGFRVAWNN